MYFIFSLALSLIDLTHGKVNISALSVIRTYIVDDPSKGWSLAMKLFLGL